MRAVPGLLLPSLLCLPLLTISTFSTATAEEAAAPALAYAAETAGAPPTPALQAIGKATAPDVAAPVPAKMTAALSRERAGGDAAKTTVPKEERECLATAIYFEARGEPQLGQAAVAQVVLNRVESPRYPDSICDVVYQNKHLKHACQFSFACDGQPDAVSEGKAWARAKKIADEVTAGRQQVKQVDTATHYHATYVAPYWAPTMRRLVKIGAHVFYRG